MSKPIVLHFTRWAQVCLLVLSSFLLMGSPSYAREGNSAQLTSHKIPPEAMETLAYIRKHGEAPQGYVGGRRFGNYGGNGEQKLPTRDAHGKAITYQEWDIHPKVRGRNRGAERIVTGSDGRAWYTADHYSTFTEIVSVPEKTPGRADLPENSTK